MPLSKALIGTWRLVSREDRTASGERRIDPGLGADPIALLVYDRGGNFAAQFMKQDRRSAPSVTATSAPNNSQAVGGYDAYFGSYTVDDAADTVTQRLVGALSAGNVGLVLTRSMQVSGDELVIQLDTASADGTPVVRTLRWTRAG
ncbi:MAG TPA: lipocalin-like domain-containing protein [Myxococcaceae bacterium]